MKKNITKYITIENGNEDIEEKKYTASPYAEFERRDKDSLRVSIFYFTVANIPLYYALIISLIITIPMIIIQILILSIEFLPSLIIVLFSLNCALFLPAFLLRQHKKNQSFEFLFDKISNKFMKLKIKSKIEKEKIFESDLSDIHQLEISSKYIRYPNSPTGTTKHKLYFRLNDQSTIKFFYISYPNTFQILDYALWVCDFLNIKYELTTPYAKKVFRPEEVLWDSN